jgi:hypothetical protein
MTATNPRINNRPVEKKCGDSGGSLIKHLQREGMDPATGL